MLQPKPDTQVWLFVLTGPKIGPSDTDVPRSWMGSQIVQLFPTDDALNLIAMVDDAATKHRHKVMMCDSSWQCVLMIFPCGQIHKQLLHEQTIAGSQACHHMLGSVPIRIISIPPGCLDQLPSAWIAGR